MRILIVDDDDNIRRLLRAYVEREGYEAEEAARGDTAVEAFERHPPSLVLLDLMLPGLDGMEVCRRMRRVSSIPIIMLTAKDETVDKILGLELGADDYITKPFDPKEVIARIKACLRRTQGAGEPAKALMFPELSINLTGYEVTYKGEHVDIPPKELELLHFLAAHTGQVFTREQLLRQVWDYDYYGDSRTVDVHIKRLREKFQGSEAFGWQIRTVWGVGYKFEVHA
jgi:DNA-binding response OmpR family regulator